MSAFVPATHWFTLLVSGVGLYFAWQTARWVRHQNAGDSPIPPIALLVQYRYAIALIVVVALILVGLSAIPEFHMTWRTAASFLWGAITAMAAGYIAMAIVARAADATVQASVKPIHEALQVAFSAGGVVGISGSSLALLGMAVLALGFSAGVSEPLSVVSGWVGFGFGVAMIGLFACVSEGIFAVAAHLVQKPDDPAQGAPIVVATVGAMGADLFGSYVMAVIAAMVLAFLRSPTPSLAEQAYPLWVAAAGILIAIGSTGWLQMHEGATIAESLARLRSTVWGASALVAVAIAVLGVFVGVAWGMIVAALAGLLGGLGIAYLSEYYASDTYSGTHDLAALGSDAGLVVGMQSTLAPVVVLIVVTLTAMVAGGLVGGALTSAGFYGVAIAAVGMLSVMAVHLAVNSGAKMANNPTSVSLTNSGFSIASTFMSTLALLLAFIQASGLTAVTLPFADSGVLLRVISGLMFGAGLPLSFSAQIFWGGSRVACLVASLTDDAQRVGQVSMTSVLAEMLVPALIATFTPILITLLALLGKGNLLGQLFGAETLVGALLGALLTSFLLALIMSSAGGMWQHAKLPLNSLLRVMAMVALLLAPLFAHY